MNKLRHLYNSFADHQEGGWVIMPQNAISLYALVKERPVKRILDLGTGIGCSAAMIAYAMEEKGETDYEIHTVEQTQKCVDLAKELIPEELQKNMFFHHEEVVPWTNEHIPFTNFSTYKNLPEGHWDLILNDGPGPFEYKGHYVDLHNGTILKFLLEQPDLLRTGDLVAFDGRIHSLKTIERMFGDNFYILNPSSEFNVIERRDNPIKFHDNAMVRMRRWNYFGKTDPNVHTKMNEIREQNSVRTRGGPSYKNEDRAIPPNLSIQKPTGRPDRVL